jgi:HEAT repeat protein
LVAIGVPALDWMLKNKLVTADRFSLRVFNAMLSATGDEGKALVPPYIKSSDETAALTALSLVATYKIPTDPALLKDALVNSRLAGGAIRAAGATKAVELVPALIGFAEGTDRNRSLAAILALDAIGSEDAAHTFVKLCTSPDLPIRVAATKALGKHADRALEAAKVLLTREGRPYRVGIELLGAIGTEQSVGLLLGQLKSPLAERRIEAIRALAFLDPVKYAPQIEPFTKDTDADVKAMARWALSRKP